MTIANQASEIEEQLRDLMKDCDISGVRSFMVANRGSIPQKFRTVPWLQLAVMYGSKEIISLFVEFGYDINEENDVSQNHPISYAFAEDSVDLMEHVLRLGANPNLDRCTISATTHSTLSLDYIKLLEQYGADLDKDYMHNGFKKMINALSMAEIFGKQDVVDYLRSKGYKTPEEKAAAAQKGSPATQPPADEPMHEVFDYFKKIVGTPEPLSIIQIIPTGIPVSIHAIPSAPDRPYVTLFTTGLSDHPMNVPEGQDDWIYAELYIQLPADWKYKEYSEPNWGWPQHWLRSMAQYPSQNNTWLGGPVTLVANEDPPKPLAANTTYTTLLLLVDRSFTNRDGHKIQLYRMLPLYTEERDLELREGIAYLMNALDRHNIPFVVDMNRKNVALDP